MKDLLKESEGYDNAELRQDNPSHLASLHSHMLRHTFGINLAKATRADRFQLERRLGQQTTGIFVSTRCRLTSYVEKF